MSVIRTILKRIFEATAALAALAVVIAASGGAQFTLFGYYNCVSVQGLERPLAVFVLALCARLWLAVPIGSPTTGIDWLATRAVSMLRRAALRQDKSLRPSAGQVFRILGLPVPGTDLVGNGARVSLWLGGLLVLFLVLAPSYRYLNGGANVDLPMFTESMESAIRGRGLVNSVQFYQFVPRDHAVAAENTRLHAFSSHFNPILYLLVPFYWLAPSAITLFVMQALLIASSVWPLFQLAKAELKKETWAVATVALFCMYPSVVAVSWHFLPCVFPIAFLIWAFWALSVRRYGLMSVCLLLALASKEAAALPVMSFGAYLFLKERQRFAGLAIALFACAWLLISLYWVIPLFTPAGAAAPHAGIYAALGSSFAEAVKTLLVHPRRLAPYVFSRQTLKYIGGLLFPLAFLPAIGWDIWLLNLPTLLLNLFAGNPGVSVWYRWPAGHWSATLVPFTFLAFIQGLKTICRRRGETAARAFLACAFVTTLSVLPGARLHPRTSWSDRPMQSAIKRLYGQVPPGARLSSDCPTLLMWDYGRYQVSVFPCGLDQADYVFVAFQDSSDTRMSRRQEYMYFIQLKTDGRFKEVWASRDVTDEKRIRTMALYQRVRPLPRCDGA